MSEFEKLELTTQINDLLLHYKNGHDDAYVEKAQIVKKNIEQLQAQLEASKTRVRELELEVKSLKDLAWGLDEYVSHEKNRCIHGCICGLNELRDKLPEFTEKESALAKKETR